MVFVVEIIRISVRAARYIACDSHAHLISKDGSVISRKSPSAVFKWRLLRNLTLTIACDSSAIQSANCVAQSFLNFSRVRPPKNIAKAPQPPPQPLC